jgi:hypothetical protein
MLTQRGLERNENILLKNQRPAKENLALYRLCLKK